MYLGIDLGTSGVKVLLMDDDQRVVASATAPLRVSNPHDMWSEQDPADWIAATDAAMTQLKADAPKAVGAIRGIGLSGQMHGATLLDAADQVLRPCILWNDTRSHAEAATLDADPAFRQISGNIVFPGFTAPKLVWVKNNEPDTFEKVHKVLLPKDYLRLWLTGGHVSEMSDAAGTSWLDVGGRCWSDQLLEASGMTRDQMPDLVEGSAPSGALRAELANRWGLPSGVIVAGGAGDNAASAVGLGTVAAGDGFVSLGTSGVVFAATDSYLPKPESAVHAFCHALPDTWHQMGVILSAASALSWFAGVAGQSPAALTQALGDTVKPAGAVTFLPYLSGERTPHNDANLRGSFLGLSHSTGTPEMTRALLEGVTYALRDNLAALESAGGHVDALLAVGGGARSRYWLQLIATVLGVPVQIAADGDYGAAFGAARLGLLAATGAAPADICTRPTLEATLDPDLSQKDSFDAGYQRFRSLRIAMG
ncbi:xylulokinase [Donghicola tyrosinivorans]|uniref:Xylulose kinase n=1 Tax=Donghicola tyrosinivorans TaxID=1652492 RepID=A0A2T0WGZ5_9RHOB|nr:xylulokinase [Donghicola tyrosinivorans]PRY85794.1 xylulokinase [Donghicola tyrosinivorans]